MIVDRCYDVDVVRAILTHPAIYECIAEDGTPPREDLVLQLDNIVCIVGIVCNEPIGVMIYHSINGITWECHVQVLPEYRKEYADEFFNNALDWAFGVGVKKIVAQVPFLYPNVKNFALRNGFEVEGINKQSYLKNGQIHDQWYLGLTR